MKNIFRWQQPPIWERSLRKARGRSQAATLSTLHCSQASGLHRQMQITPLEFYQGAVNELDRDRSFAHGRCHALHIARANIPYREDAR